MAQRVAGYIDGIPFMVDDEEDNELFRSLSQITNISGAAFESIMVSQDSLRDIGNEIAENSPYGIFSVFSIPYLQPDDLQKTGNSIANTLTASTKEVGTANKDPYSTIWVFFKGFRNKNERENYLGGTKFEPEIEKNRSEQPLRICLAYLYDNANDIPFIRFSEGMMNYYFGEKSTDIFSRINAWAEDIVLLSKEKRTDTNKQWAPNSLFTTDKIRKAFEDALPKSIIEDSLYYNLSEERKQTYSSNYNILTKKGNKKPQTEQAIEHLCKLLLYIDIDIIKIYNRTAIDIEDFGTQRLTAADIYHMIEKLKQLETNLPKFNTTTFQSGVQLVSFVNQNFVEDSAINEKNRFIIDIPFKKLSYDKRKEYVDLLLREKRLEFSGLWRHTTATDLKKDRSLEQSLFNPIKTYISAGDVLFNLFVTANDNDLLRLVTDLNTENKIINLLDKSYYSLLGWFCKILGETYLNSIGGETYDTKFNEAITNGNIIFFDGAFLGNRQIEKIDTKNQKISLEIKESLLYSSENSPYNSSNFSFIDKHLANNAHDLLFKKKGFDPLEMIVLIPVADIESKILGKIEKGQALFIPACMAYALFREDTFEAIKIFGELTLQIGLCYLGVGALTTAIRVGRGLGIFLEATDMTLGVLGATINTIPEIRSNHPKFVEYTNYATLIYALARLGYAGYMKIQIGDELPELVAIRKQAYKDFIKQIPKKNLDELLEHILEGHLRTTNIRKVGKVPSAKGIHTELYCDNINRRIVLGSRKPPNPLDEMIYEAEVQMMGTNNTWIEKLGMSGKVTKSTFFPKNWDKERILEEIALAWKNKTQNINPLKSHIFRGKTTYGLEIEFVVRNKEIKTVYPIKLEI